MVRCIHGSLQNVPVTKICTSDTILYWREAEIPIPLLSVLTNTPEWIHRYLFLVKLQRHSVSSTLLTSNTATATEPSFVVQKKAREKRDRFGKKPIDFEDPENPDEFEKHTAKVCLGCVTFVSG